VFGGLLVGGVEAVAEQPARPNAPAATRNTARRPSTTTGYRAGGTLVPVDLYRPSRLVAPDLLGAVIRVDGVAIRLTEVEAYEGESDPASHAWRGRTPRNSVMYGRAGRLYVYLSYGIHSCVNVVCGVEGTASAVLLRAGEVVAGEDTVRTRRGAVPYHRLASGPGNLGSALGLTPGDSGLDLDGVRASLVEGPGGVVAVGPRVGISRAADKHWRFWLAGEPSVSAYSRSPRA
jgi:DNA-3-methyladenine glycosylase